MKKDIYKIAQMYEEKMNKSSSVGRAMGKYTAVLRGLSIIHQQAHWTSKSTNYYGDHLLFDRLYNETSNHIDDAAEKTIGLFGMDPLDLESHIKTTKEFVDDVTKESDKTDSPDMLAKRSLLAEETFLKMSKTLYDTLKEEGSMSLGLDDMIMAIANDHETFVYLLKQRLNHDNS